MGEADGTHERNSGIDGESSLSYNQFQEVASWYWKKVNGFELPFKHYMTKTSDGQANIATFICLPLAKSKSVPPPDWRASLRSSGLGSVAETCFLCSGDKLAKLEILLECACCHLAIVCKGAMSDALD